MDIVNLVAKLEEIFHLWGFWIILFSALIETTPLGWAIPGGTIVAIGGFFSKSGSISFIAVVFSGSIGMLITFLASYALGNKTGAGMAKMLRQEKNFNFAKKLLDEHGPTILTTSLLANLTRFWISYVAGYKKYNLFQFFFYALVASLTWSSLLATIGYIAGVERGQLEKAISRLGIFSWILLMLSLSIIFYWIKKDRKKTLQ